MCESKERAFQTNSGIDKLISTDQVHKGKTTNGHKNDAKN